VNTTFLALSRVDSAIALSSWERLIQCVSCWWLSSGVVQLVAVQPPREGKCGDIWLEESIFTLSIRSTWVNKFINFKVDY
jgi:hypothetical protein